MKSIILLLTFIPVLFFPAVQTPTALDSTGSAVDVGGLTSASIDPDPHSLIIVFLASTDNPIKTHNQPTSSLSTGTWIEIDNVGTGLTRLSAWYAIGSDDPGTNTITQTFSANAVRSNMVVIQVTGFDRATVIRESGTSNGEESTCSITLTDLIVGTLAIGAFAGQAGTAVAPGSGETELSEQNAGGVNAPILQVQYDNDLNEVINWTSTSTTFAACIAFEVNSDPGIIMIGQKVKVKVLAIISSD